MASDEGINISNPTVDPGIDKRLATRPIGETVEGLAECRAFAEWVRKADLQYVLNRTGLHTLFAPKDAAFREPSQDDEAGFLNRHLLNGASKTFDLSRCDRVRAASGETLAVAEKGGRVGSARIVRGDISCTNGVIHVIESEIQTAANAAGA